MPREFRELSPAARKAIVDCVLGDVAANLPESVKDEIRDWATPLPRCQQCGGRLEMYTADMDWCPKCGTMVDGT